MRIRLHIILAIIGATALAACAPTVPNSGAREAQLRGSTANRAIAPPGAPGVASLESLTQRRPRGDAPTTITQERSEWTDAPGGRDAAGGIGIGGAEISDEQNFEAVAERETIESDRARLEQLRAQRVTVAPTALPTRTGEVGPNIVAYALNSRNRVGEQIYSRLNPFRDSASERNCAAYAGPDQAQIDFLRRGGPERDPRSLDPDGDGFACDWNPAPFRAALGR
jgi:hypothetical protein